MVYGVIAHVVVGRQRMTEHALTRLRYRRCTIVPVLGKECMIEDRVEAMNSTGLDRR
jgi:hypothetical protein